MKKSLIALFFAATLIGQGREVTLKGEVLDQHCFIINHGHGLDHAGCSNACISRNVSVGFLADDGQFYLLLGETMFSVKDQVAGMAGKHATVTGIITERGDVKAFQMKKIEVDQ